MSESAAGKALELVTDGASLGLGSGRAATAFVRTLGDRVRAGLRVRGVATSQATADLAAQLGIPLTTLADIDQLDMTIDGADEVDPQLNLIKGYGRALVREKVVAAASKKRVILADTTKQVPVLGTRGKLPVEVLPFALPFCVRKLRQLNLDPVPYEVDGKLYVSDNGNPILDCGVRPIADPAALETALRALPGVVGTGLFLDMADIVFIQDGDAVRVYHRNSS